MCIRDRRTRVQPGRMFLVDTAEGRIVEDEEIKEKLASAKPYGEWINENFVHLDGLPQTRYSFMPHSRAVLRQRVFGITEEDVDLLILPMALSGSEAVSYTHLDVYKRQCHSGVEQRELDR